MRVGTTSEPTIRFLTKSRCLYLNNHEAYSFETWYTHSTIPLKIFVQLSRLQDSICKRFGPLGGQNRVNKQVSQQLPCRPSQELHGDLKSYKIAYVLSFRAIGLVVVEK